MDRNRLELESFLRRVLVACKTDRVAIEAYASRRAFDEMGWGLREIKAFLPSLERTDFVRTEPRRRGPGQIWMFDPYVEPFGEVWIELVLFETHPSDGEGEP